MLGPCFSTTMLDNCIEKQVPQNSYISYIKIGGVPILPPLVTLEKRLEIQKYRKQAVQVERRIKTRLEQKKLTLALNKTLENSLAFDSLALEVCDEDKKPDDNLVPLIKTKPSQLSCNIFDVTEYNDNGITLFNDFDCESHLDLTHILPDEILKKPSVPSTQSPPRLLRSNSYVLDAPSPVLMQHFKKHIKESPSRKRATDYSNITSTNLNDLEGAVTKKLLTTESVNEIIKDLASVHFGSSQSSKIDYTREFIALMNAPKESKTGTSANHFGDGNKRHSIINGGRSSSLNNSDWLDTTTDPFNSSSVLLIDFESDTGENLTFCCDDSLSKGSIFDSDVCYSPSVTDKRRSNCSKALFADSPKSQRRLQKEWAAMVLTAAAKGYLVRRLKRTERVRNLIQTIADAVQCAVNLHLEKTDAFMPADVELNRRLMQQISAACYEFYDIFFHLSTKEKMEMIALDRQRMKEKLKRPASALKINPNTSDSSQRKSLSSKQNKTLVSSLVA